MRQLRCIWFLVLKDLKLFATDRMALAFFLLFPFLFVVMFNILLSDEGAEDDRLELHLVTQEADDGLSYDIIQDIQTEDESELEPGDPIFVWDKDYDEARRAVEEKEIAGFVAFPADFTQGVTMGYGAQLEVVADAEAVNTRAALNGVAQVIASRVGAQQVVTSATIGLVVGEMVGSSFDVEDIGEAVEEVFPESRVETEEESFIELEADEVGEVEPENAANYVIPGYLVMFVFFGAALSAETIVRERQNHTLERLLTGSVRRESLLAGMFGGTAAKGLIQILIFWAVGILIFRIDLGLSPGAVILLSILMVLMSSAFAIMLATLVKTQRAAGSIASLTSLVLAPLGGCWWPLFIMPKWIQFVARLTPHGWATTGFNKLMLFGADFSAALPQMLALAGFALAFAVVAMLRFRTSAV